jgi:hypothetical protein
MAETINNTLTRRGLLARVAALYGRETVARIQPLPTRAIRQWLNCRPSPAASRIITLDRYGCVTSVTPR